MSITKQPTSQTKPHEASKRQTQSSLLFDAQMTAPIPAAVLIQRIPNNLSSLPFIHVARLQRTIGNQMLGEAVRVSRNHQSATSVQRPTAIIQRHPPPPVHWHPHPAPRALNANLELNMFAGSEMEDELIRIGDWLSRNPSSSEERDHLVQTQKMLQQALERRQIPLKEARQAASESAGTARQIGISLQPDRDFSTHFGMGFGAAAASEIRPSNWRALAEEIKAHEVKFHAGVYVGYLIGAAKQVGSNIEALLELAWYLSAPGIASVALPEAAKLVQDERHRQNRLDQLVRAYRLASEISSAVKDPGFWAESGEQLGEIAGLSAGEWFNNSFMQMGTFDKGMAVGDIIGRAIIEVLLLFVGIEELAIKGGMAIVRSGKAAAKFEKVVAVLAKRLPSLRKLLEARKVRKAQQAARDTMKVGKNVEHGTDAAHKGAYGAKPADPWEELGKELNTKRRGTGVAHPSPTRNLPDEIYLPPIDYHKALRGGHVERFFDDVAKAIDHVGYETAEFVVSGKFKYHNEFIQACRKGNWASAGNYFHIAASEKGKAMSHLLPNGYVFEFEKTLKSGKGGSRYDVFVRTPEGELLEFDWKTTGRSAISSIPQMERHAKQTLDKFKQGLSRQESVSWTEFVRPVLTEMKITDIKWP